MDYTTIYSVHFFCTLYIDYYFYLFIFQMFIYIFFLKTRLTPIILFINFQNLLKFTFEVDSLAVVCR